MSWTSSGKPGPAGWIPWAYWTEYIVNDLFLTHTGKYTKDEVASMGGWAMTTAMLFAIPQVVSKIGLGTVGWVTGVYYTGKYLSQIIDPTSGKENYYGFLSGGIWGNEPNYGSAQMPGSGGYFDLPGNLAIIILHENPKPEPYWSNRANTWVSSEAEADEVLMRQLRQSVTSGSFTSPYMLYQLGYISTDEYLRRLEQWRVKDQEAKAAKRRWNALSKNQQKGIVGMQRAMNFKQQMLFAAW